MRFSAAIKTEADSSVDEGSEISVALHMLIEGICSGKFMGQDSMFGRNITGTRDWDKYKIVLDVPEESGYIEVGVQVKGMGEAWIAAMEFEETTEEVTAKGQYPDAPSNLDFAD